MGERALRGIQMRKFYRQNGEIVRRVLIILFLMAVTAVIAIEATEHRMGAEMKKQVQIARIEASQETEERVKQQLGYYEQQTQASIASAEAQEIAKVLYGMQYNTDEGLRSACWCVINRVESSLYPDTVAEVCAQKSQFMGWSDKNPVVQRLYNIALAEVGKWHNGIHAVGPEFIYLEWTSKEITLRTTFDGGRGCHYWYESDWK